MKYKIGITSYDNDHQLWETHIGLNDELEYSVWGKTEQQSKEKALELVYWLIEISKFHDFVFAKVS